MIYLSIVMAAFVAGIVQGVTGFGGGVIIMMILPLYFAIPQGAGITVTMGIVLCGMMVIRYRKDIKVKMAITPSVLYLVVCSIVIHVSTMVNQAVMKKIFGVFLLLLAIYYLFFTKSVRKRKLGAAASVLCIVISAACDGLFGIGGPLMVLYFMNVTDSTHEYLGTLQLFFMVNSIYNTVFRFYKGILLPEHLIYVGVGLFGILSGVYLANKIVDRLNANVIRKLTYVMIGVSGVLNLIG
ncbi:MAG: sulfite exporter TauE/SafE family protein [Clostridium sp.]|nr:sulfite exporter TauE/SafE family protein [Clostridium sp.]